MATVKVKKRTVDPNTGNVTMEPKVVEIPKHHPWNSVEYHRLAEEMGVSAYERTTQRTSTRIVTIYNYLANLLQTNDAAKIADAMYDFKKNSRADNMEGRRLVDRLYRVVRDENMKMNAEFENRLREEGLKYLNKDLSKGSERAEELRGSSKVSVAASKETKQTLEGAKVKRREKKVESIEEVKRKDTGPEPVEL